jgi:hypothetical protein
MTGAPQAASRLGGKPDRVVIDAVTGQAIADPEPLLDAWTPEKELYESLRKLAHD